MSEENTQESPNSPPPASPPRMGGWRIIRRSKPLVTLTGGVLDATGQMDLVYLLSPRGRVAGVFTSMPLVAQMIQPSAN